MALRNPRHSHQARRDSRYRVTEVKTQSDCLKDAAISAIALIVETAKNLRRTSKHISRPVVSVAITKRVAASLTKVPVMPRKTTFGIVQVTDGNGKTAVLAAATATRRSQMLA